MQQRRLQTFIFRRTLTCESLLSIFIILFIPVIHVRSYKTLLRINLQRWIRHHLSSSLSFNMTYLQRLQLIILTVSTSAWRLISFSQHLVSSLSSSPFCCHVYFLHRFAFSRHLYVTNASLIESRRNAGRSRNTRHANCWQMNSSGALPQKSFLCV